MSGLARLSREYSVAERIADGVIHVVGIAASLIAVPALLVLAMPRIDGIGGAGLAVYGTTLIVMLVASAAYNMVPYVDWKPLLRRFDQTAIFLKIAGTYTPLVIAMSGLFAYGVLVAVWIAALCAGIGKLAFAARFERLGVPFYLLLGWASLLLAWPIFVTLPVTASVLLVAGGILYSIGVVFHLWDRLRFQNAIWHGFVLAASACHFAAISMASLAFVAQAS